MGLYFFIMVIYLKLGYNATRYEDKVTSLVWAGNDIKEYQWESMTPNIEKAIQGRILVYATQLEYAMFLDNSYVKDSSNYSGIYLPPNPGVPIPTSDDMGAFDSGFNNGFEIS